MATQSLNSRSSAPRSGRPAAAAISVPWLISFYLLARGQDRRDAELSDIHTFEFDEGISPCFPVIMTTRQSKANQHGRTEMMGAFRNVDPFICPIGALGFYFLYRWDLTEEPFPDFSKRWL
jgi:centromere DNA-binding complex CBF3 subunit-like protein